MTSPCMGASYGDMRRLKMTMDAVRDSKNTSLPDQVPAIEVWALYALNLHKATMHGWERNPDRKDKNTGKEKRNFIIGRGGYIGLHRFAGLWTGDNSSSWDFLSVSVAQVLSLGLSGITISGGDVGGFERSSDNEQWASPELVMRWYCAYSLLPWFRNHYNGKPGRKLFQEPFRFIDHINQVPDDQKWMYRAVLPVCRYYVRLRYSLLQLLYDQMFDNLLTGLPIARSLIISNEEDASLYGENYNFLDDEYMVGDDLLVAPVLWTQADRGSRTRDVYLPRPSAWWQSNLRADGPDYAVPLSARFDGGSLIPYDARMSDQESQIPWMNPMFINMVGFIFRLYAAFGSGLTLQNLFSGAIIPQIQPRRYAEDTSVPNPISILVYPGHDGSNRSYDMYLDDGVSRESAPTASGLQKSRAINMGIDLKAIKTVKVLSADAFGDDKAADVYWKVRIAQETKHDDSDPANPKIVRTITVENIHTSPYFDPTTIYGPVYQLVVWAKPKRENSFTQAQVKISTKNGVIQAKSWYDGGRKAWIVELPIQDVAKAPHTVEFSYKA
ncbi:glycoside hydrolase family 31 protein [Ceratobasidium sp. AG-Ba]|nr:glycoside hydrolase family 31 protein [Ceratobasidium sp. AG-Ba]